MAVERRSLLAAGLAGLALSSLPRAQEEKEVSDRLLRRAFRRLKKEQRRDVVEWLRLEHLQAQSFQSRVLHILLDREPESPDMWTAQEDIPWYDPKVHTPDLKKKVRRKRLSPRSSKAKKKREEFLGEPDEGDFESIWNYHWGDRRIYKSGERIDPERLFENAVRGHPPDVDLVHELALKALDDGREHKLLAAFSHAYSDRDGKVYPGLTIYDAWSSGKTIEMPDVDVLGIVHDVIDDWTTWKAPIPGKQHGALYGKIGEWFQRARRYRALREALAKCLLTGRPNLGGGYDSSLDALHALWDEHGSDPARLRETLPDGVSWRPFLVEWLDRTQRDRALLARGRQRRAALEEDARRVRSTLVYVMREYGALGDKD